jgi:hypothetical protein
MSNSETQRKDRDLLFLSLFLKRSVTQVTDQEVAYYRQHPNEIDEVTAPLNVHLFFLWAGTLLGIGCVALSKSLKFYGLLAFLSEGGSEFVIDIVFEIGVALIGAAVTAYLLGILLNRQQDNAKQWRKELRRRIQLLEKSRKG